VTGTDEATPFEPGGTGATSWTTGRIITKDFPAPHLVRLRMHVEDRQRHWPGQHYLIWLRAPDDYTAQRSYSLASDDSDPLVEFLVERLPDGEVSEFLADEAEVGDVLELRGPIGRWFRWDTYTPSMCLVGGTGVVPAVSMIRAARHHGRSAQLRVMAVARSREELPYADELARAGATIAYTREGTDGRPPGPPAAGELAPLLEDAELAYVCGSARFAQFAEELLLSSGVDPQAIRVEKFGVTG
jgi:ferredoxin-NADP reductase